MFGLIRRISYSVIPRPDRPWEDDPTSNAPNTRRKRRISSTERDAADATMEEQARKKKIRADSEIPASDDVPSSPVIPTADSENESPDNETSGDNGHIKQRGGSLEFKAVTKGVKEVDLEDKEAITNTPKSDNGLVEAGEAPSESPNAKPSAAEKEGPNGIAAPMNPEAIPLPEEKAGELDEEPSSSLTPEPLHTREDSTATAVESSEESPQASKIDTETPTEAPSQFDSPRLTGSSRSSVSSSARKLRSKSPKKVSAKA